MAAQEIGSARGGANGGIYSGNAFKEGTATTNYTEANFLDIGFGPEMVFIKNTSGNDLFVAFVHKKEDGSAPDLPPNTQVDSKLEANESRVYRRRNHRYLAIKGNGGYQVEAW